MPTLSPNRQNEIWKGTKPKDPGGEKVEWWWWICLVIKPKLPSLALSSPHPPLQPIHPIPQYGFPQVWTNLMLQGRQTDNTMGFQIFYDTSLEASATAGFRSCTMWTLIWIATCLAFPSFWWAPWEDTSKRESWKTNISFATFGQIAFPAFGQIWSKILFKRYIRFHQSLPWPWIK